MFHIDKDKLLHSLNSDLFNKINCDVLRLDNIHNVISGNKYFKLKEYLKDAKEKGFKTIASFGGAYSNHIVAMACACKEFDLQTVGFIRGDENTPLSHTLKHAVEYGMELQFVSREDYRKKEKIIADTNKNYYWIDEGGYGKLGAAGAADILSFVNKDKYTKIFCACGTGTTMAGLIKASLPEQKVIGINVLKGYNNLIDDIELLLDENDKRKLYEIINGYHFGGYAKANDELYAFMNLLWKKENVPADFVYTAKLFYAINDMVQKQKINSKDSILIIHSGGLQGNKSLGENILNF